MRRQLRCVRTILERNYYGMCLDFEDSKFLAIDPLTFASIMPNRKETSDKRGIKLSKLLVWNFRGFHSEVVNCTCSLRSETSTGKDFNFLSGAGTLTHSIFLVSWEFGAKTMLPDEVYTDRFVLSCTCAVEAYWH